MLYSKIRGTQSFRSLEMHSKRSYKICICSVIRGELEDFRNYKGFTVLFPKSLDEIARFKKVRFFLIPHVHSIIFISLNPKILGFLFNLLRKLAYNIGNEMLKLQSFRKSYIGIFLKNRKLYRNKTLT